MLFLLTIILLFCFLLAAISEDAIVGFIRTVFFGFALYILGTMLFYAWGFYLYLR